MASIPTLDGVAIMAGHLHRILRRMDAQRQPLWLQHVVNVPSKHMQGQSPPLPTAVVQIAAAPQPGLRTAVVRDLGLYNAEWNITFQLTCELPDQFSLGVISWVTSKLNEWSCFVTLYRTIILPNLDFASAIWNSLIKPFIIPSTENDSEALNKNCILSLFITTVIQATVCFISVFLFLLFVHLRTTDDVFYQFGRAR